MADVDTRLVQAVKGWGQGPSWQIKVLEVLGTKNDPVKLWFIDATTAEAIAEANTLLEQGERLPCHGGCRGVYSAGLCAPVILHLMMLLGAATCITAMCAHACASIASTCIDARSSASPWCRIPTCARVCMLHPAIHM